MTYFHGLLLSYSLMGYWVYYKLGINKGNTVHFCVFGYRYAI